MADLGHVFQLAEKADLKSAQCEFESHHAHQFSFDSVLLLLKKITILSNGCWIVTSQRHRPRVKIKRKYYQAAQVILDCFTGEFYLSREACHTCSNIRCINPKHLYWGTRSQNMLDAVKARTHGNIKKTHCPRGHKYDIRTKKGYRECSACNGARGIFSH